MKPIEICARPNDDNIVTKIFSTALEQKEKGDVTIDQGFGDKYVYISNDNKYSTTNEKGQYIYKIKDESMIKRDLQGEETKEEKIQKYQAQKEKLIQKLNASDYKVIKYIEGVLEQKEFLVVSKDRQSWREEINQLEEEINKLN